MRLIYRLALGTIIVLVPIMFLWGTFFYNAMMDEVMDELDDNLEDYSEEIIMRALGGEELPSVSNGSNNQYYLTTIDEREALSHPVITYADSMVYIIDKKETEPARILETVFVDDTGRYFKLTVAAPSIDKYDVIESIFYWIVALYVLLLLTIVTVNILIFYRNLRPLYILLHWLDSYQIGKENTPLVNDTKILEFKKLNEAVINNTMRHELYNEQQKQFISNASHEMQTPVAICMNRIEMLMNDEGLSEKTMEGLGEVFSTLQHLSKMNKSLLMLSRIDNGQYSETADVNFNNLFRDYLQNLEDVYSYMNIRVNFKETGKFEMQCNKTLAEILVTNILKNAFLHNCDDGEISVVFSKSGFVVSNTGAEKSLDPQKIFTRFYQGGHRKEGSTGLGLAIASSVCKLYGLSLSYDYKNGVHSFEVKRK